jgi:hypothetical protein
MSGNQGRNNSLTNALAEQYDERVTSALANRYDDSAAQDTPGEPPGVSGSFLPPPEDDSIIGLAEAIEAEEMEKRALEASQSQQPTQDPNISTNPRNPLTTISSITVSSRNGRMYPPPPIRLTPHTVTSLNNLESSMLSNSPVILTPRNKKGGKRTKRNKSRSKKRKQVKTYKKSRKHLRR